MPVPDPLAQGRDAYARRQWRQAFDLFAAADRDAALAPPDLVRFGEAAYLVGADDEAIAAWTRAHTGFVEQADTSGAVGVGFWLSLSLLLAGKGAQSGGWLSRCQRLLGDSPCAERGRLLALGGLFAMHKGEAADAVRQFQEATTLAGSFGDPELLAMSVLGHGQALIQMQRVDEGVVLLDEAMVAVTSGQVSPILAGVIYCAVILTCERVYDLRRAQEWTAALDEWCQTQSELVAYRGPCLMHRAEVLLFKGDWAAARIEAGRAYALLSARSDRQGGRALYQQAELHRLAGELSRAEALYRDAGSRGFDPEPGASLLRLARGDVDAAAASIQRGVGEAGHQQGPGRSAQRIALLEPFVEIMLAKGDIERAREAALELSHLARERSVPYLDASAAQATGAVRLASSDPDGALLSLRRAWTLWQQLEAPFESARARVLIARACEHRGDKDAARLHLEAAAAAFERLGAKGELTRLGVNPKSRSSSDGLSGRERQVLGLVAAGSTNRQIASQLKISEHTVARHVSSILNKLGVHSRTAASVFAFEHGLVSPHAMVNPDH